MKRIILFSTPTEMNNSKLLDLLFPDSIEEKIFAFMPSDGANTPKKYIEIAMHWAKTRNAEFLLINNALDGKDAQDEVRKLENANILCISGGITFTLLRNLKRSGLDRAILGFVHKPEFVLGGYSAGAMIMSPSIEICRYGNIDENRVSLAEFSALGLFDFEVFPHYEEENEQAILAYEYSIHGKVLRIPNEEIFFIDMKNESKASIDKVKRFE